MDPIKRDGEETGGEEKGSGSESNTGPPPAAGQELAREIGPLTIPPPADATTEQQPATNSAR